MEIKVGGYHLSPLKKFDTPQEAIDTFVAVFPLAIREDVEKEVNRLYNVDKSTNTSKPIRESGEDVSRPDAESVGEKQVKGTKRK